MSSERLDLSVEQLGRALDRLDEVLALPGEGPMIDATIQRFEFTIELLWKTIKRALEEKGLSVSATPADVLSAAWQADWLDEDERTWIGMLKARNRVAHVCDEAGAREIYGQIPAYAPFMRRAYDDICRRFAIARPAAPSGPPKAGERKVRYRKAAVKPRKARR